MSNSPDFKIDFLVTDTEHPVVPKLTNWADAHSEEFCVRIIHERDHLRAGNILFLVSCSEIVSLRERSKYKHSLVLHASDLPLGRGWSPHIWSILEGSQEIVVSLINAEDKVDTGDIWAKKTVFIPEHALYDEINDVLFGAEIDLINTGIRMIQTGGLPIPQIDLEPTYWPRRNPTDSQLDPNQSLKSQFDLIRVSDPKRYPAYFKLHGHNYEVTIRKRSSS